MDFHVVGVHIPDVAWQQPRHMRVRTWGDPRKDLGMGCLQKHSQAVGEGLVCWTSGSPDLPTVLPYLWLPKNQGLFSRKPHIQKAGHFWQLRRGTRVS